MHAKVVRLENILMCEMSSTIDKLCEIGLHSTYPDKTNRESATNTQSGCARAWPSPPFNLLVPISVTAASVDTSNYGTIVVRSIINQCPAELEGQIF